MLYYSIKLIKNFKKLGVFILIIRHSHNPDASLIGWPFPYWVVPSLYLETAKREKVKAQEFDHTRPGKIMPQTLREIDINFLN